MSIVMRVRNILTQPDREWGVILRETSSVKCLYLNYAAPLASVGPVAAFIGLSVTGFGSLRMPLQSGLSMALMLFAANLIGVFLVALIIEFLAVRFDGEKNGKQAFKLAVYAATPLWLAGVLMLVPALGGLSLLVSLYGIYLLYLGLPVMMGCPRDKAVSYTVAVVAGAIVVNLLFGAVIH